MNKLLFNNIGNRHLYLEKRDNNDFLYNRKYDFRERTKQVLDHWNDYKDKIHLNILKQYLDEQKPDEIHLFFTDQSIENTQDTYYAAELVKKILIRDYQYDEDQIVLHKIDVNPSNENLLFPLYAQIFKKLHALSSENRWIFLDAGGTPQQKLTAKLLIGAIHPNSVIHYVGNVEGVTIDQLFEKDQSSLRRLFAMKSMEVLFDKLYYTSALTIANEYGMLKKPLLNFLLMASYIERNIVKTISFKESIKEKYPLVQNFADKIPPVYFNELKKEVDDEKNYFRSGIMFAKAHKYLKLGRNEDFILTLQQSLEILIEDIYKKHFGDIQYDENNHLSIKLDIIIKYFSQENKIVLYNFFKLISNLFQSYQIHILKKNNVGNNFLDKFRNKYAHEGKAIDKIPGNIIKIFDQLISAEYLNSDTKYFDKLNALLKENLYFPNYFS